MKKNDITIEERGIIRKALYSYLWKTPLLFFFLSLGVILFAALIGDFLITPLLGTETSGGIINVMHKVFLILVFIIFLKVYISGINKFRIDLIEGYKCIGTLYIDEVYDNTPVSGAINISYKMLKIRGIKDIEVPALISVREDFKGKAVIHFSPNSKILLHIEEVSEIF